MHYSTKVVLATQGYGGKIQIERLLSDLEKLGDASQIAAKSDLNPQNLLKPMRRPVIIAHLLHGHFEELTGSSPPKTRTPSGAFYALVADVFGTLGVEGSVESAVREAFKLGS